MTNEETTVKAFFAELENGYLVAKERPDLLELSIKSISVKDFISLAFIVDIDPAELLETLY